MKQLRILPLDTPEASLHRPNPRGGPPIVLHMGTGAVIAQVLAHVPAGGLTTVELCARAQVAHATAVALDAKATAIGYTEQEAATLRQAVEAMRWPEYHPGLAAFVEAVRAMPDAGSAEDGKGTR